jgi:hypothetical protein
MLESKICAVRKNEWVPARIKKILFMQNSNEAIDPAMRLTRTNGPENHRDEGVAVAIQYRLKVRESWTELSFLPEVAGHIHEGQVRI